MPHLPRYRTPGQICSAPSVAWRPAALLLAVIVAAATGCTRSAPPLVITGLVDAAEIDIASKVPGRIKDVAVREGDKVEAGAKLVELECMELDAKLDQVNAVIEASKARLRMAHTGGRPEERRVVQQELDLATRQVELARKMYDRLLPLVEQNAIPRSKFDEVEFKHHAAQDQLNMVRAKWDIVRTGARAEEIEGLNALLKQAEGTLAEVESYRRETVQYAPVSGEVSKVILRKGELAATGYPIITIMDPSDMWVTFPMREDLLKNIQEGAKLTVYVPALDRTIAVTVTHLAAMGDFATWKATNEKGGFDLKSFEVKARPDAPVQGLRPGMTVRYTVTPQ